MDFVVLADHRGKIKESEKIDKYLELARELKKNCETLEWRRHLCAWKGTQKPGKKTGGVQNQRKNWDHLDYSIV